MPDTVHSASILMEDFVGLKELLRRKLHFYRKNKEILSDKINNQEWFWENKPFQQFMVNDSKEIAKAT